MEKLLKISIAISLIGTLILLLLTNLPQKTIKINQITENKLNQKVKIQGKVISEKNYEQEDGNFKILTVEDETSKIQVTLNSNQIWKNKSVEVTGKVEEYKSKLQIQADKIVEIKNDS